MAKKTEKSVTRKINGQEKQFTPTENFVYQSGVRLASLEYQFELLGKQTGNQYAHETKHIEAIKTEVTRLFNEAIAKLENPIENKKTVKAVDKFVGVLNKA